MSINRCNIETNNPIHKKVSFIDFVTLVYVGYTFFPSSSNETLYVSLFLLAVWLFTAFLTNMDFFRTAFSDSQVFCVVFFVAFVFINGIGVAGWRFTVAQVMAVIMQFSYIVIFNFYLHSTQLYKFKNFFYILLVLFIVIQIITFKFYSENEGAARDLARDSSYYGEIRGVGGYSFAYSCAIFSIVVLNVILDRLTRGFLKNSLLILVIILSVLVIIGTESTTTLIAYFIGVFVCVFFRKNKHTQINDAKVILAIKMVVVILLLLLMFPILKKTGEFLIDISASLTSDLGMRIRQLGSTLIGDANDGDYTLSRMSIPLESFKTFLKNPIIGICHKHGNGYYKPTLFGAGNHCEWVDALTNYGLIGGIPYLAIYIKQVRKIGKLFPHFSIAWVVCMFVMGLFNPFRTFSSHIVLFFMLPSLTIVLSEEGRTGG